ncbi:MAG: hypothetical protein H0X11_12740, partial [Betaproteobacteria bacterium]|nr:hypothetical protein [Betaproteobacteria bacterium]
MTISASRPSPFRRFVASALAFVMAVGPLASPGYAALTNLADEPLNIKTLAKPNIVLTVDDSTSMLFDYLPDYIIGAYCRDGSGRMSALCGDPGDARDLTLAGAGRYRSPGYIFQQFNAPYASFDAGFDPSGPGAGCDLTIAPFGRCSGGVDPGPSPGIATYPATSIKSGQPFEYWKFWPAPVHSSALNHLYYNPRLEYEPPAYADGTSYPQMNAGNTTTWTRVPADPWATTIEYVNLTTPVTVGQWCNSDWTQGSDGTGPFVNNAGHCRVNGLVAAASAGAPAADGDYTYPWAWPGDAAPKNQKHFYQNDNSLWCDATHASWPQTGAPVAQTCNGVVTRSQTCSAQAQTCGGGQAQTCNNPLPQTCSNAVSQICVGISAQTCTGVAQTCGSISAQTCGGVQTQTCNISAACDPPVCRNAYDPPGCETCTGSECPVCRLVSTCAAPVCRTTGSCSVARNACTTVDQCPTLAGICS